MKSIAKRMDNVTVKYLQGSSSFAHGFITDLYNLDRAWWERKAELSDIVAILELASGADRVLIQPHPQVNQQEVIAIAKAICVVAGVICPFVSVGK